MIELRHLKYVIAVADEGHLTRAAERLGIQQPPLTRQIRALEKSLGVQLFHRLPRGVRPTEAGLALVEEARGLLARAEQLPELARRAARGERGRIGVGFTSSAAFNTFVSAQIRAFRRDWPQVRVALEEEDTGALLTALREERLEAAFVRTPTSDTAGLMVEPLLEEAMLAVLPADHPLAANPLADGEGGLDLADLAGETFILYRRPAGPGLYDAIIAACRAAGFSPSVGQEAPRMPSTLSLVAAGLGVSIVPESMRALRVEGVMYRPLTGCPGLVAPLLLATRTVGRSAIAQRFREQVRASARHWRGAPGALVDARPLP